MSETELPRFIELVKNGYIMTHYVDGQQKDVYQAYALGGDVIKSHSAGQTIALAHEHLRKRLAKGRTMFNDYSDEDLRIADNFTDAMLKFLKDFDYGDSEVVGAQIEDMIKNYEAASLELFTEIGNRKDAKAMDD